MTTINNHSEKLIIAAMVKLLETSDIDAITVTDITHLANISRGEFYSNFEDITSLLDAIKSRIQSDISSFGHQLSLSESKSRDDIYSIITYAYKYKHVLRALFKTDPGSKLVDQITSIILTKHSASDVDYPREVRTVFFSFGYFGVIEKWIYDDTPITPDELTDLIYSFTND